MSKAQKTRPMPTAERNLWPGQATQSQRRAARNNVVLAEIGVSASTRSRYFYAVNRLRPILDQISTETELDDCIAAWIQSEFEDGTPLYLVGDALSGLHHLEPFTKRKLVRSWQLYSTWRKYEVPMRAPPLPQDLVLGMAGWCLCHGELAMGAMILLGFHALLRTGELLAVRPCDFLFSENSGLVSLPSSKSGLRNNAKESVSLHDPSTIATLQAMVEVKSSLGLQNVPCWDRSGSAFRALFSRVLSSLGLEALHFRPYSLRRGGATYEMQTHGQMERTLLRGRWRNSNIARIYICDGLSMLPKMKMTWEAKKKVSQYSAIFEAEHCFSNGKRGKKRKI